MKIIALISCGTDDSYHSPLVQSFIEKCAENDCRVLWFQSLSSNSDDTAHNKGELNIFNLINYEIIDAVVILSLTVLLSDVKDSVIKKAGEHNIPIISIDGYIAGAYNISLGYVDALEEMVRHVITKHGAKNIKFLGGSKGNEESDARENIFRKVMAEYNLEVTDDNVDYGYFWWSAAADAVQRHYDKFGSMPDAFVCANDSMAVGVCGKLNELGFNVPDDVIVTGIDGIPEGNTYFPSITTLMLDINSAGTTAANRVMQILNGDIAVEGSEKVEGTILYRESCGCEPARLSSDDNELKHDLYGRIDLWNGFSDSLITMSEAVTNSSSFEETLENIKPFLSSAWTKECWLCICDNFITDVTRIEDISNSSQNYQRFGYTKIMKHVIRGLNDCEFDTLEPFESSELVPNFKKVMEKYNNIMFLPINFRDRTIGYFALEFTRTMRNYHILRSLLHNISRVLENARIQSELKSVVNRLEDMYIHDSMTSLYNRRGFYQLVPKIYNRCRSNQTRFMVLSVDLDNLKGINDTYGHSEGDAAITTIADALLSVSDGEEIIIARFGGDEYIAAGACPCENYSADFMKKFQEFIDNYNAASGKPYTVSASRGIYSLVPPLDTSLDEFIKSADELMYYEKATHRKHHGYSRGRM
ncbi:MAG: GGDEF domain-containing protein [Oscillospiraceae bacterium]|nr:GGDEF domain-containing protein [Oscillospiraceae bacterium]